MTPPPPSKSATIPSFYTVHVCSFSFKGLSQSQRLGGQKWVSWNKTYSYLMCYATYLWILSLIFNYKLNLYRETHLPLRNPKLCPMVLWLLLFRDISDPASSNHILYMYDCNDVQITYFVQTPLLFFLTVKIFVKSPFQPLQTKMMNSAEVLLPFTCFFL